MDTERVTRELRAYLEGLRSEQIKISEAIAKAEQMLANMGAPVRRGPGRPKGSGVKRGPGRPKGSGVKRGPGRPKGSGVKRGPGRPKGSGVKRGPGRPKGSGVKRGPGRPRKNPLPTAASPVASSGEAPVRRGPGRPKGSKNKKKRGPGRPKGSGKKVLPKAAAAKAAKRGPADWSQQQRDAARERMQQYWANRRKKAVPAAF